MDSTENQGGSTVHSEKRKFVRARIDEAVSFQAKDSGAMRMGSASDISLGGMFIATPSPLKFGQELTITLRVRGSDEAIVVPAICRWTRDDGMGVQFGLLGVRATHIISELTLPDNDD